MEKVLIYDTTLRDGTQGEGISLSVEDKLKIALRLDQFGVHYIEGGWPGSNPKDMEFFQKAKELPLTTSKITAFGSTRRHGVTADQDENLQRLLESGVSTVTIFGKTWDFQVTHALNTTLEENLDMIFESVQFLKSHGLEVIFDAEHFFDGYKANPAYALKTLRKAEEGGADWIVLCDTNGGTLPHEIETIVVAVKQTLTTPIGVHCHNDSECAVANTLAAVRAGARQVQGTMNGYGERCGNANLVSVIPNLQVKLGYTCVKKEQLGSLTSLSRYIHEIANVVPPNNQPFVGMSAFAHKGGMHVSAVLKSPETYEHLAPERVGNTRRVLVSELSGQSNLLYKAQELNIDLDKSNPACKRIIQNIKEMEHEGYQYEGAEASFELLLREGLGEVIEAFTIEFFNILVEKTANWQIKTMAVVKVRVFDEVVLEAAEGNGPVNAFDNALRKALESFYPEIKHMHLSDYKVRVLDGGGATAAKVKVLIESSNGKDKWSTVGVSTNIIEASWQALSDSFRYFLLKQKGNMVECVKAEVK
ncbi:citramalate synthase [Effusibacillus lacus]|uniref:Citramalate synthase n=1 Tax=Effusibacillus lacus TaxID=1348429 RepID=A0A292YN31_9BACL|nr:citramalate synthase [Effusibacillus lacus]TCS67948.1 (R)-citramalate synthase [Effusibacillus lacus]GAX89905.1 citramalate synthase [Effusibacillus lacus]